MSRQQKGQNLGDPLAMCGWSMAVLVMKTEPVDWTEPSQQEEFMKKRDRNSNKHEVTRLFINETRHDGAGPEFCLQASTLSELGARQTQKKNFCPDDPGSAGSGCPVDLTSIRPVVNRLVSFSD